MHLWSTQAWIARRDFFLNGEQEGGKNSWAGQSVITANRCNYAMESWNQHVRFDSMNDGARRFDN